MQDMTTAPRRSILRESTVLERIPVHPTTIYRWEREGKFPRRVALGKNSSGWYDDEIDAWIEARREQSSTPRQSPNPKACRGQKGDQP
jgi:prophage regulatory protein